MGDLWGAENQNVIFLLLREILYVHGTWHMFVGQNIIEIVHYGGALPALAVVACSEKKTLEA